MTATVIHGECIAAMREMPSESVDSIVTDPPYGLGFMGKKWDSLPPGEEWARECLRVLRPGGHMLAFGGTRTWHRLAVAIEDAGFEIRDSIAWLYSQGFPRAAGILKPAFEPVVVARAPLAGSLKDTIAKYGTGALQVEAGRVGSANGGRWPANVATSDSAARTLDSQSGVLTSGKSNGFVGAHKAEVYGKYARNEIKVENIYADSGGASRFFYCAKASPGERVRVDGVAHPTVKPLALMRWLVRLATPPGGTVVDPFAGSGTTLEACQLEGFNVIGIEREAEYIPLIDARLERVSA